MLFAAAAASFAEVSEAAATSADVVRCGEASFAAGGPSAEAGGETLLDDVV